MRASSMRVLWGCAAMMLVSSAAVAPSASATAEPNFLVLTVRMQETIRVATLRCDPAGSSHPNAAGACAALDAAGGDFSKLIGQPDTLCPDIFDPVTARAQGEYRGTPVAFYRTYPNRCALARQTAPVFEI